MSHPMSTLRPALSRFGVLAASFVIALLLTGCNFQKAPLYDFVEGQPMQFKRYDRNPVQDFIHRFGRKVFDRNEGVLWYRLSEDQRNVIGEYGQPDFIRRPFTSRQGEQVTEWVYLDKDKDFQFVRRQKVWEGPVTDMEKTLITYGIPRRIMIDQVAPNIERETFIYSTQLFTTRHMIFSFANGRLILSQSAY
ncbi:MAG: hypothetical protein V2A74_03775 [bacterium]